MPLRLRVPRLAALTIAIVACSASDNTQSRIAARDSASVRLVDVEPAALAALPEWKLDSADLIIGAAEGASEYLLHRAGTPRRLGSGRIVVSNNSIEIRYYAASGKHLMTVGRQGDGPGDFRQLWNAYPLEGDSVLALDISGEQRASVFDSLGRFIRSFKVAAHASYPLGVSWLPDRGGVYLNQDHARFTEIMNRPERAVFRDTAMLMRMTPDGLPGDSITRMAGYWWNAGRGWGSEPALSGEPVFAATQAGIIVAHGDEFVLRFYDLRGALKWTTRVLADPPSITPGDKAHYDSLTSRGRPPVREEGAPARVYAPSLPMISRVRIDAAGRIWVRRWAFDDATRVEWIVFDATGVPIARLETPALLSFVDMTETDLLGRYTDGDGVHSIRRYRIQRPRQ